MNEKILLVVNAGSSWYTENENRQLIVIDYHGIEIMEGVCDMPASVPSDGVIVRNARFAVKTELEKKRVLNQPIARFDPKSGKVYMEHADGSKTLVGEAMRKGGYGKRAD